MQLSVAAVGAAAMANGTKKTSNRETETCEKAVMAQWQRVDATEIKPGKNNSTSASMMLGMTQREGRGRVA